MQFTVEEKQIIGFYCITDRTALIQELSYIIPHIEDAEFNSMDFTEYRNTEDFESDR